MLIVVFTQNLAIIENMIVNYYITKTKLGLEKRLLKNSPISL